MPSLSSKESQNFLAAIQKKVGRNGLERMRTGGLSGFMQYNFNLMKLLSTTNSCLRIVKSALWLLLDRNGLGIHLFYFGQKKEEKNGNVKSWRYSTPQVGGQFMVHTKLLGKPRYYFLQDFIATKPLSAQIIVKLKNSCTLLCGLDSICPEAVSNELKHIQVAQDYIRTHLQEGSQRKLVFSSFYRAECTNYTLVCHPVGRHLDVYKKSGPGATLENRICFSFNGGKHFGYGRGGKGRKKFVFALLGW
jgi:hypothetical protein